MSHYKQGNQPIIGIFWLVNDEFITEGVALEDAEENNGIYDFEGDHYSFWERWTQDEHKELARYSYDHFPRGRIVYDANSKMFIIYCDKCIIKDKETIARLLTRMNLLSSKYEILPDVHYQCHTCNPYFISDEEISLDRFE